MRFWRSASSGFAKISPIQPAIVPHFRLAHAASRQGRSADADAAGVQRWPGIERNHVLVDRDAGCIERHFSKLARQALGSNVNQ